MRHIGNHDLTDHAMKTDPPRARKNFGAHRQHSLRVLNVESFCESVLSCLKLVVSDLHVSLKTEEIRILVMFRMNHGFMEYMRTSYPDTPLSEFKAADTYVRAYGGVGGLDDDEDDEDDE